MPRKPDHADPHHHTVTPAEGDARDARALGPQENADLCAGCVRCCTYITIQIDTPRAAWEYDQWLWTLHHEGIEMYVEKPESWFVHVETRCRQLNEQGRCGIHGRHPVLCRDYDPRSCERRLPLAEIRAWFKNADALEDWLRRERPSHWRRLEAYRRSEPAGAPKAAGAAMAGGFIALDALGTSRPRAAEPTAAARVPVSVPSDPSTDSAD